MRFENYKIILVIGLSTTRMTNPYTFSNWIKNNESFSIN